MPDPRQASGPAGGTVYMADSSVTGEGSGRGNMGGLHGKRLQGGGAGLEHLVVHILG